MFDVSMVFVFCLVVISVLAVFGGIIGMVEGAARIGDRRRGGHVLFWPSAIVVGTLIAIAIGQIQGSSVQTTLVLILIANTISCCTLTFLGRD